MNSTTTDHIYILCEREDISMNSCDFSQTPARHPNDILNFDAHDILKIMQVTIIMDMKKIYRMFDKNDIVRDFTLTRVGESLAVFKSYESAQKMLDDPNVVGMKIGPNESIIRKFTSIKEIKEWFGAPVELSIVNESKCQL